MRVAVGYLVCLLAALVATTLAFAAGFASIPSDLHPPASLSGLLFWFAIAFAVAIAIGFCASILPMAFCILQSEWFGIRNPLYFAFWSLIPPSLLVFVSTAQAWRTDFLIYEGGSLAGCLLYWAIAGRRAGEA
jgi:hypothetical protein